MIWIYNLFLKMSEKILLDIPDKKRDQKKKTKDMKENVVTIERLAEEIGRRWHSLEPKQIEAFETMIESV
jgi:hypothetical protein